MDDDGAAEPEVWRGTFRELARVNRVFGGWGALRAEIDRLPAAPRRILDVAAGGADLSVRLLDYLGARGVEAHCTALDRSRPALDAAALAYGDRKGLKIVWGDARRLEFGDRSFDLAMVNLALHHFDGEDAVAMLRELARVAANVIVNDLRRSRFAWVLVSATFPVLFRNPLVRNDGPLSVRRAYTPAEAAGLAKAAGWRHAALRTHPWFRMTMVGGYA